MCVGGQSTPPFPQTLNFEHGRRCVRRHQLVAEAKLDCARPPHREPSEPSFRASPCRLVCRDLAAERRCIPKQFLTRPDVSHGELGELPDLVGIFRVGGNPFQILFQGWEIAVYQQQFHSRIAVASEPSGVLYGGQANDGTKCPTGAIAAVFRDTCLRDEMFC